MQRHMNISIAQKWVFDQDLDAYIHLHTDPHQSEYLSDHWQGMAWLSGFTGSAGAIVITKDDAALWADSRYHIQAEHQIEGRGVRLMKQGLPETPNMADWLEEQVGQDAVVGIDPRLITVKGYRERKNLLKKQGITLIPVLGLLEDCWRDRPVIRRKPVMIHAREYAGRSREEKIVAIRAEMAEANAQYLLMPTLDDIAWTLNLRGSDIDCNPVFMSYLLIGRELGWLFIDDQQISYSVATALEQAGIQIMPYDALELELNQLEEDDDIWIDPARNNYFLFSSVPEFVPKIEQQLPSILMKACKNEVEQAHSRVSHQRDGLAMVRFLYWLETHVGSGSVTERVAAERLEAFRAALPHYQGKSFVTIPGYAHHAALPHYSATEDSDLVLLPTGMFLIDSGGQFLDGTTDITRTVALGPVDAQMKTDFTLVLKGHIALSTAIFPEGTQGVQLDALARQYLWKEGLQFGHGTGHGVGFYLNVHEGPAGIGYRVRSQPALAEGMLLSNEPGLYRAGKYGIRIENLMFVQPAFATEFGHFLKFEPITLCPIDQNLIDVQMLSAFERDWLNQYHQEVYQKLAPDLEGEVLEWLKNATRVL